MDARAVAETAGVGVATLNVWIQRGLIPGMTVGARGRQRDFDLDTATHIMIMTEIVKLGFGAPFASEIAKSRANNRRLLIREAAAYVKEILRNPKGKIVIRQGEPPATAIIGFQSESNLPALLEKIPGGRPAVYVVVDIEALSERVRRAFEQAEQLNNGLSAAR
jgi:DNA-binding transcriptional MerR regulator